MAFKISNPTDVDSKLIGTILRREELSIRLMKALAYLPLNVQVSIILSWIPIDDLEKIVEFQEKGRT